MQIVDGVFPLGLGVSSWRNIAYIHTKGMYVVSGEGFGLN